MKNMFLRKKKEHKNLKTFSSYARDSTKTHIKVNIEPNFYGASLDTILTTDH